MLIMINMLVDTQNPQYIHFQQKTCPNKIPPFCPCFISLFSKVFIVRHSESLAQNTLQASAFDNIC